MYKTNDIVWFARNQKYLDEKPNTRAVVDHSFVRNNTEYVVVTFEQDGESKYVLVNANRLWDDPNGESNIQKKLRDKNFVVDVARRAGILDSNGNWDIFTDV